ncbi:hypothetical protein MM817_02892 [Acidibacillus sp. S0AB]|uniref:Uncharacterized protein n=1 Tax=Sulfoacidibacillus ferrooxidans TaxID=2005001 RepID=A0A9X1VC45_9BACL|nr:hypothetical protein [Sulfoacidibacillus ferrooxidans]
MLSSLFPDADAYLSSDLSMHVANLLIRSVFTGLD